jgi:hypothetical protein
MLESKIEKETMLYAAEHGWLCRKIRWIGRRGAPDRLFIRAGRIIFVEFKKPKGTPRIQQEREIERLEYHGAKVYVINDISDATRIFY